MHRCIFAENKSYTPTVAGRDVYLSLLQLYFWTGVAKWIDTGILTLPTALYDTCTLGSGVFSYLSFLDGMLSLQPK